MNFYSANVRQRVILLMKADEDFYNPVTEPLLDRLQTSWHERQGW